MGLNWERNRMRKVARLAERQRIDDELYTRDLDRSKVRHPRPPPVSKAQLRAEIEQLGLPPPWGPWTEWKTVWRPDGTTYKERERTRRNRIDRRIPCEGRRS